MLSETDLDLTFAALAHPARRRILARLSQGQASVTELAKPFEMSQPAISKHLKVLEKAGLVARGKDAQWRPSQLRAEPLRHASEWIATYREYWEKKLDRLDTYLQEIKSKENTDA